MRDDKWTTQKPAQVAGKSILDWRESVVAGDWHSQFGDRRFSEARKAFEGGDMVRAAEILVDSRESWNIQEAMVSDDFSYLTGNYMWKSMIQRYRAYQFGDWRSFCKIVPAKDFKAHYAMKLSSIAKYEERRAEGEGYPSTTLSEAEEHYTLQTWGNIVGVTRELLINDDLNALSSIGEALGRGAAHRTAYEVFNTVLYASGGAGQTMGDAQALFYDRSGDTIVSTDNTGSATFSEAGVQAAWLVISQAKDEKLEPLGLTPKFLITSAGLAFKAQRLLQSDAIRYYSGAGAGGTGAAVQYGVANVMQNSLGLISSSLIDDCVANAQYYYYLCTDPSEYETIRVAFLNGQEEPDIMVEAANSGASFEEDVRRYKGRIDFTVKAMDWRGWYRQAATE